MSLHVLFAEIPEEIQKKYNKKKKPVKPKTKREKIEQSICDGLYNMFYHSVGLHVKMEDVKEFVSQVLCDTENYSLSHETLEFCVKEVFDKWSTDEMCDLFNEFIEFLDEGQYGFFFLKSPYGEKMANEEIVFNPLKGNQFPIGFHRYEEEV